MTMPYEAHPIADNFYEIAQGGVRCFLFTGDNFALLIDTGFGGELKSVVEAITDKPIKLLHTHCDRDHIGASAQFEELYMHPAEFACCLKKNNIRLPLQPVWEGDCIEVGGYCLEVVLIPGHTPGSIALLDRKHRFLISGDSVQNGTVYMFGEGRDLCAFEASMAKLQELQGAFDVIYPSHGDLTVTPDTIGKLHSLASEINRGILPEPKPAPDTMPEGVKIYSKAGVQLFLNL